MRLSRLAPVLGVRLAEVDRRRRDRQVNEQPIGGVAKTVEVAVLEPDHIADGERLGAVALKQQCSATLERDPNLFGVGMPVRRIDCPRLHGHPGDGDPARRGVFGKQKLFGLYAGVGQRRDRSLPHDFHRSPTILFTVV